MESHVYGSGNMDRRGTSRQRLEITGPTCDYRDFAKPLAGGHRSLRIDVRKIARRLQLFSIAAIVIFYACAVPRGSSQKPAPAIAHSGSHIYVTTGGLNGDCYQDLGQLTVKESFAQSVIETGDSEAERLRELAREKYSAEVDAVIKVHEQQNEAGTDVELIGEAVHLQNHETVACAARGMPEIVDSAGAAAAGGIVGTVIGGLAGTGGSVYGAEAGGAMGAATGAGMELAKHRQQQQTEEAFISDRLQQQRNEIAQLYQQLAKLIEKQCDTEELSEQDCNQRIAAVQQQIATTNEPAPAPASSSIAGASASTAALTEFRIHNRMQEQQEIIDQLQRRIAQIKQSTDNP